MEQLVNDKTVSSIGFLDSYSIEHGTLEQKIALLQEKLKLNKNEKAYVFEPFYYYKLIEATKTLFRKFDQHLTAAIWNHSEDGAASFKCITQAQLQNMITEHLQRQATAVQKELIEAFYKENAEYIDRLAV